MMVTVGLGLGPLFSRRTETKTGPRLFGIFQPNRDPDRRSGTPLTFNYSKMNDIKFITPKLTTLSFTSKSTLPYKLQQIYLPKNYSKITHPLTTQKLTPISNYSRINCTKANTPKILTQ